MDIHIKRADDFAIHEVDSKISLENLPKKVEDNKNRISYYDFPGYSKLLTKEDKNFSKLRSVILTYTNTEGVKMKDVALPPFSNKHSVNALRKNENTFLFVSDSIIAETTVNSWIDLHKAADKFLSKSYSPRLGFVGATRILYDFAEVSQ